MKEFSAKNRLSRSMKKRPNKRSKCYCGCSGRSTHMGLADGAGMMSGCELSVRRWVRDGSAARTIK
jgi:hypothetical protein